ncbi:MAG TPA: hypothetical protein VFE29_05060 [Terriglobia bacterium]|nr:hypothetical protein [Terriglobia bacterium]
MRGFKRYLSLRPALLVVTSLALLAATPAFRAAEALPDELSDESFWKMVADMSEPDGWFQFENFLSNELGYQYVIPQLVQNRKPGGVYIGVAPEQNFTYIAALKPRIAFIVDIRRQNMLELFMYKALFELSETRADFISRLFARRRPDGLSERSTPGELFEAYRRVRPDADLERQNLQAIKSVLVDKHKFALRPADLAGDVSIEYIYSTFVDSGPGLDYSTGGRGAGTNNPSYQDLMEIDDGTGQTRSYLASEENYRFVRDMQKKNLIVPLVGDFAGPRTIRAVGTWIREHDSTVTAFYLSNVEQYLFNDFRSADFYENVATLPLDSGSTFIRSFSGGGGAFRFRSTLSSIRTLLDEFRAGKVRQYGDVKDLSQ